jgi:hypothetical protein
VPRSYRPKNEERRKTKAHPSAYKTGALPFKLTIVFYFLVELVFNGNIVGRKKSSKVNLTPIFCSPVYMSVAHTYT